MIISVTKYTLSRGSAFLRQLAKFIKFYIDYKFGSRISTRPHKNIFFVYIFSDYHNRL